jgi:hypothetical protein
MRQRESGNDSGRICGNHSFLHFWVPYWHLVLPQGDDRREARESSDSDEKAPFLEGFW